MALIEVNLEKPALVEEYRYPGETTESEPSGERSRSKSDSSGGSKAKLLGLLGVLAGVGLLVWKLKRRGGSEQTEFGSEEFGEQESEPEPEIGGGDRGGASDGAKGKVAGLLGLVVAVAGLAVAVQKRRS
jgi:hypothetical protein